MSRHRALARVLSVDVDGAYFEFGGSLCREALRVPKSELPRRVRQGDFLHAVVDLDAEHARDLKPTDWEDK
jgi:hypothetical protein